MADRDAEAEAEGDPVADADPEGVALGEPVAVAAGEPPAGHHPSGPEAEPGPAAPPAGTDPSETETVGRPAEPQAPPPSPPGNQVFHEPSRLDQKARLLADFFNGDVIDAAPNL